MSSYIDSINQATTAATGSNSSSITNDAVMGKEDFLMLLVAQLQNQDPLSPDDPTEFTAQLAQFSSLEQLFTLNEGMDNMVNSNANSDRFATLNTIGRDVAYNSSSFNYTGNPVEIGYQLDGQASEVTLSLQHEGVTIATLKGEELTNGSHFISWDGQLADGKNAPAGDYEIVLQAKAAADESVGAAPLVRSEVTGVDLEGNYGGILITKAGDVAFNSILGVYEPGSRASATPDDGE
jgi:flagellar basal-body rod modification protein FlgD